MDLGSNESINRKQSKWVKITLDTLRDKDHELHSGFRRIVAFTSSSLDDHTIYKIYQRITDYTMRAYAGFRNNMRNNPEKRLSKSQHNVKFRTLVQTGSKVRKSDKPKQGEKKSSLVMMTAVNQRNGKMLPKPNPPMIDVFDDNLTKDDLVAASRRLDQIAEGDPWVSAPQRKYLLRDIWE